MKNKLMLVMLLGMFLISFTSALDSLGTFKQNQQINITQICNDATYITISSVSYPNSSKAIGQVNMTSLGSGEFYIQFTNTSTNGRYDVRGVSDGCDKVFATYFEITPSGFVGTLGFYIIILILSLGLIILGYAVEDAWVVILGGMGFVLFGLFVYIYGINGMKDTAYTYGFAIITIMLGAYFSVRGALQKMDEGIDN
jgi:hypothetical protein